MNISSNQIIGKTTHNEYQNQAMKRTAVPPFRFRKLVTSLSTTVDINAKALRLPQELW